VNRSVGRRIAFAALLAAVCAGARGAESPTACCSAGPPPSGSSRDPPAAEAAGTGRVLVRLAGGARLRELLAAGHAGDAAVESIVTRRPLRAVVRAASGSPSDARRLAEALGATGLVDYAVAERYWPIELRGRHTPNDPLFPAQWPLDNAGQGGARRADLAGGDVDAPEAWSYTRGSPDVLIAVLDDGVQLDHPDLATSIAGPGRDFAAERPTADASPRTSADRHGTSVAGIIAAVGDNGLGVSGICPRCRVLPIRVSGSSNLGTAAAFRYAVEQGADIVTNSWGYSRSVPFTAADAAVRDAIDTAARDGRAGRGALIVFGMTNESVDNCSGPNADISSLDSVLAVGVANHNDEVGGSGFGACMDLVAPAKPKDRSTIGVPTTDRTGIDGHTADDYYTAFGGTSAAAPLVAGIAGLLLSLNPELTRSDLVRILEHTADKIDPGDAAYDAVGFSMRAGHGRVNAARALVPTVTIAIAPARVAVDEPFSVTIAASAPFGLDRVSWSGRATGVAELDAPHERTLAGERYRSVTWSGLTVDAPGVFTLAADARDLRYAEPPSGYPHRASERAAEPTVQLTVFERSDAVSR
jgi:subtilisin family serine protease